MPINIAELWDFGIPELSEMRFREALEEASPDDRAILETQIARTYGLRHDFDHARRLLSEIEPRLGGLGAEVNVRYWLELGRSHCSTAHPIEDRTESAKATGRECYLKAFEIAKAAKLDYLAIDALHMMTMVDVDPDGQVEWNRKALDYMAASDQDDAKNWEGSLRNNLGYAYHLLGRYDAALSEFKLALAAREKAGKHELIRIAKWMIAWTYRAMGRFNEAIEIQLALEKELNSVDLADPYVFEELEHLYRALGNDKRADHYKALR
ncbi:MAG: tetratricopeptide repeat protein [Armatimonadetes bacterium]|nr:tetratricopeptide repeat protein [Armatimonadota bacterium]